MVAKTSQCRNSHSFLVFTFCCLLTLATKLVSTLGLPPIVALPAAELRPPFAGSITCSTTTIDISLKFEAPFHGAVFLHPYEEQHRPPPLLEHTHASRKDVKCSISSRGGRKIDFHIDILDESSMQRCGIARINGEYMAVMEIAMISHLHIGSNGGAKRKHEEKKPGTYLIKCPTRHPSLSVHGADNKEPPLWRAEAPRASSREFTESMKSVSTIIPAEPTLFSIASVTPAASWTTAGIKQVEIDDRTLTTAALLPIAARKHVPTGAMYDGQRGGHDKQANSGVVGAPHHRLGEESTRLPFGKKQGKPSPFVQSDHHEQLKLALAFAVLFITILLCVGIILAASREACRGNGGKIASTRGNILATKDEEALENPRKLNSHFVSHLEDEYVVVGRTSAAADLESAKPKADNHMHCTIPRSPSDLDMLPDPPSISVETIGQLAGVVLNAKFCSA